jgi:hypothetical protein
VINVKHCFNKDTNHAPAHQSLWSVEDPGDKDAIKLAYPYSVGIGEECYTNNNGASFGELIVRVVIHNQNDTDNYIYLFELNYALVRVSP